jgi:ADP-heptose:LPS heptosyltransferase
MILVLRALGLGDLATIVPALRALRRYFPDHELVLVAPRWLSPVVDLIGAVDRVLPAAGLEPVDWPTQLGRPHRAVNLHGRGPQSHHLLRAVRPDRLLAFACPEGGHADGPCWAPAEHEVTRWCRLLSWYGIPADAGDLALRRPVCSGLPVGVSIVHPGAKAAARRWPAARFAAVARGLRERGHRVVITGSTGERRLAEDVARSAGLGTEAVWAGRTDVAALASLVARARLLVSGDTGVGHLATAYGTPSVLLFGPVPPAQWGPPADRPRHQALWRPPAADAPDAEADGVHPALAAIQVSQVLNAVDHAERVLSRES